MKRFLFGILLVAALAACGPAGVTTAPSAQQPLPTPSKDWTSIKMTHSGGIMGLLRVVEISRDGSMTVADERTKLGVSQSLTETELAELSRLIASFEFLPPSKPSPCADCFIYSIEITRAGASSLAEADDISLAESGMEPLVTFLRGLMDQALK